MKTPKTQLIVLVDDNPVTNFFNKTTIEKSKISSKVVTFEKAQKALDYIDPNNSVHAEPEYIFLDLHMPTMNGWEFLEKYKTFNPAPYSSIIILHDSSLLPEEQEKLNDYSFVKSLHKKALTQELLFEICQMNTGYANSLSATS